MQLSDGSSQSYTNRERERERKWVLGSWVVLEHIHGGAEHEVMKNPPSSHPLPDRQSSADQSALGYFTDAEQNMMQIVATFILIRTLETHLYP
ncbi:hypothetical protein U1Q18_047996 [Sarracenia purpurea var. burkii]